MNSNHIIQGCVDCRFYLSRRLDRVIVPPEMIQIMLTSRCNIRCKICDVWKQRFEREMTTDLVKDIIRLAVELGVSTVYFTGGEALLRDDIVELIDCAAGMNVITTVNTNGIAVDEDLARRLVGSGLDNITFSIDGASPGTHDAIRGKGVFDKAVAAIERINKFKKIHGRDSREKGRPLDVGITCVILRSNISELPALVTLAESLECCNVFFQPLVYNGNLLENKSFDSEYWLRQEDFPRLEQVFRELEELKKTARLGVGFMAEKTLQHFRRQRRVNSCFAGYGRIFINPQGDISFVCCEAFGNIRSVSLRQAWFSEAARQLRRKIKQCEVNCTQFCSERPQSEDLSLILAGLENVNRLLDHQERRSLQSLRDELAVVLDSDPALEQTVRRLDALLRHSTEKEG